MTDEPKKIIRVLREITTPRNYPGCSFYLALNLPILLLQMHSEDQSTKI